MLKVGIGDNYYCKPYGFAKGLERMKAHGYDSIDYQRFVDTQTPLFEKNRFEFEQYLQEQYAEIRRWGLSVHQVHGPWRHPPQDETKEKRRERFEKMSRSIEGTAILGSDKFVIHPIMPFGMVDTGYEKETWELNLEFMGRLCEVGRKNGVVVCLENMPMPKFSIGTVPKVAEFVRTIHDDFFKVCLDTGHCAVCEMSPAEAVRLLGSDYLQALHIHDNNGKRDYHWSPYTGIIDWEEFGKALGEIEYQGVFSLEVKRMAKLPEVLNEYEEIGLYQKGRYVAELACR